MNTKPQIKKRSISKTLIYGLSGLVAVALIAARVSSTQSWGSKQFEELWNGYGSITWANNTLTLIPKVSTQPSETHSAFVVSIPSLKPPYRVQFNLTTVAQLRQNSAPNPWEVGWFVFAYKPDGKFKYLLLKPNGYGLELGESLLNDAQNFLYTSPINKHFFFIGQPYAVDMNVQSKSISITINGIKYLTYYLSTNDKLTLDGKIGFYTEDANVQISNIRVTQ
jgi:hypothetical protein